jgi:hypothetical protein
MKRRATVVDRRYRFAADTHSASLRAGSFRHYT